MKNNEKINDPVKEQVLQEAERAIAITIHVELDSIFRLYNYHTMSLDQFVVRTAEAVNNYNKKMQVEQLKHTEVNEEVIESAGSAS